MGDEPRFTLNSASSLVRLRFAAGELKVEGCEPRLLPITEVGYDENRLSLLRGRKFKMDVTLMHTLESLPSFRLVRANSRFATDPVTVDKQYICSREAFLITDERNMLACSCLRLLSGLHEIRSSKRPRHIF